MEQDIMLLDNEYNNKKNINIMTHFEIIKQIEKLNELKSNTKKVATINAIENDILTLKKMDFIATTQEILNNFWKYSRDESSDEKKVERYELLINTIQHKIKDYSKD